MCRTFPDAREGRSGNIGVEYFGLSAFSMFFMQSESFLSYQRTLETGHGRSNCQTLFGIGKIHCPHCLTRKRSNGRTECYHTMLPATAVAPGHSRVVPLMPEFISPQDGHEKQDCEREAVKRWYQNTRKT